MNATNTTDSNDDYYYYYYDDNGTTGTDISFDSYEVTTVDPGGYLLLFTWGMSVMCFVIGSFALPGTFFHPLLEGLKERFSNLSKGKIGTKQSKKVDLDLDMDGVEDDVSARELSKDGKRLPSPSLSSSSSSSSCPSTQYVYDLSGGCEENVSILSDGTAQPKKKDGVEDVVYSANESTKDAECLAWSISNTSYMIDLASGYEECLDILSRWTAPPNKKDGFKDNDVSFYESSNDGESLLSISSTQYKNTESKMKKSGTVSIDEERGNKVEDKLVENLGTEEFHVNPISGNDPLVMRQIRKRRIWKETRKIVGLGLPWMIQSIIADGSGIVSIMVVARYMGLREMICYSNVWFIITTAFFINDVWYDTIYKHVNVSAAVGTDEAYYTAGSYVKIGVVGNFLLALPFGIASVIFMPNILTWIGYDEIIASMSQSYAVIAFAANLFDTSSGIIDCVLDIEGHAKFTAVYEFWESLICTPIEFFFIKHYRPNLWQLGIFHIAETVLSTAIYFVITGHLKKWFSNYRSGLRAPIFSETTGKQIKKLINMVLPLIIESVMGNVEYVVLTIFASRQGPAEAATWVLFSYVWSAVGIAPDSFGAAASCHVAKILGKGDGQLAKEVSWHAMKVGTAISMFCAVLLFLLRNQFVSCFSVDSTITQMLSDLVPYITVSYPLFTIGWTAMELNDALHLFKRAMVSNTVVTLVVILPAGFVTTYLLNYNLEGIVSAQCIGYTAAGVANFIFLARADWDKAITKANDIINVTSKDKKESTSSSLSSHTTGIYDDYYWKDLPEEAKAAAVILGYNEHIWDNDLSPEVDHNQITDAQYSEAELVLGYV